MTTATTEPATKTTAERIRTMLDAYERDRLKEWARGDTIERYTEAGYDGKPRVRVRDVKGGLPEGHALRTLAAQFLADPDEATLSALADGLRGEWSGVLHAESVGDKLQGIAWMLHRAETRAKVKAGGVTVVQVRDVFPPPSKKWDRRPDWKVKRHADIAKNESIRIWAVDIETGRTLWDKTFRVGELAEYDSYNLVYYGPITAVGEKTVTVVDKYSGRDVHRLDLWAFIGKSHDFDAAKAFKRNSEWSD